MAFVAILLLGILLISCNHSSDAPADLNSAKEKATTIARSVSKPIEALGVNTMRAAEKAQGPIEQVGVAAAKVANGTGNALERLGSRVLTLTDKLAGDAPATKDSTE